jgi:hypothetical protein
MILPACVALLLVACRPRSQATGEQLARAYCASCHLFPEPRLLDKKTWEEGVLPQMAQRLGIHPRSFSEVLAHPYMTVLPSKLTESEWQKIVAYYRDSAPATLPDPVLPAEPVPDPPFFRTGAFNPQVESSGIITLLVTDTIHRRIFVGEAGANTLSMFDWDRRLLSSVKLGSPPTGLIVERSHIFVLESGILDPNDEPRGTLEEYDFADSLRSRRVVIDSLIRPVAITPIAVDGDSLHQFLIGEFGNDRGRLALYKQAGDHYTRQVLDASPGAIHFELRDLTGDGAPDIVALFAQADERIVLFENDGKGKFAGPGRVLARFPPVYGSMYFAIDDMNGDGRPDIVYVNGDNFDYSRVLKPYHGVHILENDGKGNFHERYFFTVYGAARVEVADFDGDGDLDMLVTSNFGDAARHPERGIIYLENTGPYQFRPYSFSIAAENEWNLTALADLRGTGRPDVIIGAMNLSSVSRAQRGYTGRVVSTTPKIPLLFFENRMQAASNRH